MMKKIYPPDLVSGWEYCIVYSNDLEEWQFYDSKKPDGWFSQNRQGKIAMSMNKLGADCWELAGVGGEFGNVYIFKRPYRYVEEK